MATKSGGFIDFVRLKKGNYAASVLLAILSVFCGVVPYFVVYNLLLCIAQDACTQADVVYCALVVLAAFVLQILFHSVSTAISHKTAFSLLEKMRLDIMRKLLKLPLGYTQLKGSGYFKNTLMDEIERLEYPLAHAIPETTSSVLLPVAIMVALFFIDWRMALATVVPVAATLLYFLPLYRKIMNAFSGTYYSALENMNSKVIEYIKGIKEIKIFGRSKDAYSQYEQSIDGYKNSTLKLYHKMYFVSTPAFVLLTSVLVSVLIVGGVLYLKGELLFSIYLFVMIVSMAIGVPLLKFIEFMDNFFHIKNGKRLIDEIMSAQELPEQKKERIDLKSKTIMFDDVSFAYDEEEKVLQHVSLVFEENKRTALIGPSGSGKTTVANLVARYWDVAGGKITIGGKDIRQLSLEQLMDTICYVTQDTFLFNSSVRENIAIGNQEASLEEIENAARAAQCEEFIKELPQGYDTLVGGEGVKLSSGQRQRIVIARAILKDAPILILDEATAYADMENQQKIQQSIQELSEKKTLIIIAHRLSTVVDCDRLILMDQGTVSACGTHKELLASSRLYKTMWELYSQSQTWNIR